MDNTKVHTAKMVSSAMPDLGLKRTPQPPYSPNICPSDFFLFSCRKGKLEQQFTDPDQLSETVDEIFSSLWVDTIEDMFRNWIHRLVQVIASDDHYLQERFIDLTDTRLGWVVGG
jgi:hypothetical protein